MRNIPTIYDGNKSGGTTEYGARQIIKIYNESDVVLPQHIPMDAREYNIRDNENIKTLCVTWNSLDYHFPSY